MRLARDAGYTVVEQQIAREMLYIADEIFFTGTAAEITPIRSVDRIPVGAGKRGPVTERLQKEFFALIHGDAEDRYGWLTARARGGGGSLEPFGCRLSAVSAAS